MRLTPKFAVVFCFLSSMLLYLLLLRQLSATLGTVFLNDPPAVTKYVIGTLYVMMTIGTSLGLYLALQRTREGRDSSTRVLGLFVILLLVPHVIIAAGFIVKLI